MLIKFRLRNILSFQEEQELSLIPGNVQTKKNHLLIDSENNHFLKYLSIFGANGSGKSNLIKAIDLAKRIIITGNLNNINNLYCKLNKINQLIPSKFEFIINLDGIIYSYGFEIILNSQKITTEWLKIFDVKSNSYIDTIFSREIGKQFYFNKNYFNDEQLQKRLDIYFEDAKNQNILFLTIMNVNKEAFYVNNTTNIIIFNKVFKWFNNSLVIIFPNIGIDNSQYLQSDESIKKISQYLNSFGTGIKECKLRESSLEEFKSEINNIQFYQSILDALNMQTQLNLLNNITPEKIVLNARFMDKMFIISQTKEQIEVKKVSILHENSDADFSFADESNGTRRIFDLIEVLLNLDTEKTYFIDEFNIYLHPLLSFKFIKEFLELKNKSQLIITTHESKLLDNELIRRDEILFTDRPNFNSSELYSLEKYKERFDKKFEKAYLSGEYKALPIFKDMFC